MSLTVKRVARLMRRGDKGRHLDGGASGQRGLYLVVAQRDGGALGTAQFR